MPLWCKADYQTQGLQVVHFLVTESWRNIAKYLGLGGQKCSAIGETKYSIIYVWVNGSDQLIEYWCLLGYAVL